jgi:surface protein
MTLPFGCTRRYSLLLLWHLAQLLLVLISSSSSSNRLAANAFAMDLDNDGIRRAVALWLSDKESAEAQYGPMEEWSTWQVTDLSSLFQGATTFDANLDSWDVSSVTDMKYLFAGCQTFNSNLASWNIQQVTDLSFSFSGATNFTGESLGSWRPESAVTMEQMFLGATNFVGPSNLGLWNVSRVKSMRGMFLGATSFDRDISGWDLSNVESTDSLLEGASSFSQRVCWDPINPKARFFQAFCGTQGGFDLSPGSCPSLLANPYITAYSRACDPTDVLESITETQVFGRPEGDFTSGGLGAPENSLANVNVDDPPSILQVPQNQATNSNADDNDEQGIVISSIERDASAASSSQRISIVSLTTMMTLLAALTGEYMCH